MCRRFVIAVVALVVVALPSAFAQTSDAWVGTWKLNVAKTKFSPGPSPKGGTLRLTAVQEGITAVLDGINADGTSNHVESTAKFDGKDYPVKGGAANTMRSYKRIDNRSYEFTTKEGGKVTTTTRTVASTDGKTLTVTITGTNAQGQAVNNVVVLDKQ